MIKSSLSKSSLSHRTRCRSRTHLSCPMDSESDEQEQYQAKMRELQLKEREMELKERELKLERERLELEGLPYKQGMDALERSQQHALDISLQQQNVSSQQGFDAVTKVATHAKTEDSKVLAAFGQGQFRGDSQPLPQQSVVPNPEPATMVDDSEHCRAVGGLSLIHI